MQFCVAKIFIRREPFWVRIFKPFFDALCGQEMDHQYCYEMICDVSPDLYFQLAFVLLCDKLKYVLLAVVEKCMNGILLLQAV